MRRPIRAGLAPLLLALPLCLGAASASAAADPFEAAGRAYAEGRYDEAAAAYEALAGQRGYSAPLLFNLGNAYLRAGRTGPAILSYERARLLAPGDPDVRANLAHARQQAQLRPPPAPWYRRAAEVLGLSGWSVAAATALWLLCGALLAGRLSARLRRPMAPVVAAAALGLAGSALAIAMTRPVLDEAVVLGRDAPVRLSPFAAAQQLFTLPEGAVVRAGEAHGGFVRVRDPEGRGGWIDADQIAPVVPAGRPRPGAT